MEQASTRAVWAKRVERWADSGLSKNDFATEIGVSPHSLSWWKWRLSAEAAGSQPTPKMRRRRVPREEKAALTRAMW